MTGVVVQDMMVPAPFVALALVVVALNVVIAAAVATYGAQKGFPFAPVLIAAIFIGFPLVLLAVALMPPRQDLGG